MTTTALQIFAALAALVAIAFAAWRNRSDYTLPPGTIAALFDAIDVTELGPWAAMARLGLAMAQGETE